MQLVPKRTKYRKMQKGNNRGTAYRGSDVDFGDFAMQATEPGRLTARQIEAARMAITRHVKRAGKLWIRIFPHRPVTKKPLEVRMGGGKGGVEEWAADILPGRVMYEISGHRREDGPRGLPSRRSQDPRRLQVPHPRRHRGERRPERGEGCRTRSGRSRHEDSAGREDADRSEGKGLTNEGEGSA